MENHYAEYYLVIYNSLTILSKLYIPSKSSIHLHPPLFPVHLYFWSLGSNVFNRLYNINLGLEDNSLNFLCQRMK